MKLTLKEIWEAKEGLEAIANIESTKENGKEHYRNARNLRKLKPEFEDIIEMRNTLCKKYGATSTNPVPPENMEEFTKEFNEFLKEEREVDIQKISVTFIEELTIKSIYLVNISKFIDE